MVETDSIEIDRERIRKSIQIKAVKIYHPKDGVGLLAQFDAVIPGMMTLKKLRLVRDANTKVRTNPAWLRGDDECAVAFESWLRSAINRAAIEAVRDKFGDYFHWFKTDGEAEADAVPTLGDAGLSRGASPEITTDAAALPAMLMRKVA